MSRRSSNTIALAGLLHDLGMFVLPDSLVYKAATLTEEELQIMREHPHHGSRLFKDVGESYPWVGRVILQEHERWDGSGYPNRLTGDHIDEMALIIGLADVFDALMNVTSLSTWHVASSGDSHAARKRQDDVSASSSKGIGRTTLDLSVRHDCSSEHRRNRSRITVESAVPAASDLATRAIRSCRDGKDGGFAG